MSARHSFLLFRLIFFTTAMPLGLFLPFFYLNLREEAGLSQQTISMLTGLSGIAVLATQQTWGYVADVYVSKRRLLMITIALAAILFFVLGHVRGAWTIAAVYLVFQLVNTPISQLLVGYFFSHPGSENRFGHLRAYGSLGFIVTNIFAGYIADKWTGGNLGFIFPFYASCAVATLLLLSQLPETRHTTPLARPTFLDVQRHFLRHRSMCLFLIAIFFYQTAQTLPYAMQSFLMRDMQADNSLIAMSYSLSAVIELPIFLAASRFIRRVGELRLIIFAAIIQAVRWMGVWLAETPEQIILLGFSHCITFALFYASAVSFMNRFATPQLRSSAQTLFGFVYFGLATLTSSVVGGFVVGQENVIGRALAWIVTRVLHLPDHGGLRNLFIGGALVSLTAAAVCAMALRAYRRETAAGTLPAQHT